MTSRQIATVRVCALPGLILPVLWTASLWWRGMWWHHPLVEGASLVVALALLAIVARVGGRATVGLRRQSPARHLEVFAGYVTGPMCAILLIATVIQLALDFAAPVWPEVAAALGELRHPQPELSIGEHLWRSVYAGVVEEIVVLALPFAALRTLTWNGRAVAATGIATALLVVLRCSYHGWVGATLPAYVVLAWLLVRLYRRTQLLLPLVLGHILFDVIPLAARMLSVRWQVVAASLMVYALLWQLVAEWSRQHRASDVATVE